MFLFDQQDLAYFYQLYGHILCSSESYLYKTICRGKTIMRMRKETTGRTIAKLLYLASFAFL